MGVEHLQGRRKGRPPGSKTTPRWRRDVEWVYKHLGDAEAKPPSELARRLLALAREHPDRLLRCLLQVDAAAHKPAATRGAEGAPAGGSGGLPGGGQERRLKKVTIPEARLFSFLREGTGWVHDPPADAYVVRCEADTSQRKIRLFISSLTFPEVAQGEPVLELERKYVSGQ